MRLTAWVTVEEHISPLPVKQVGESAFVNTSTTPPVTCSEAELWENGQCGKNSQIPSRDSIIPLQSWFLLQRRLRIFKLTVIGTSSICCSPDTLGQAFQPWQAHSALENRETCSFLSHVSSEQNKKGSRESRLACNHVENFWTLLCLKERAAGISVLPSLTEQLLGLCRYPGEH